MLTYVCFQRLNFFFLKVGFPNQQFYIGNCKTFRRDRNKYVRGLLFYINAGADAAF